jgi:hypothetical protein
MTNYTIYGTPLAERSPQQAAQDLMEGYKNGVQFLYKNGLYIAGKAEGCKSFDYPNGGVTRGGEAIFYSNGFDEAYGTSENEEEAINLIPLLKSYIELPFDEACIKALIESDENLEGFILEEQMQGQQESLKEIGPAAYTAIWMSKNRGGKNFSILGFPIFLRHGYPVPGFYHTWATVEAAEPETPETEIE